MENKLDFLMRLTDTKNSVLSKIVSFDPSYISRIRNGSRGIPNTPQFLEPAASFFARNIRSEGQRMLLWETIGGPEPDSGDREKLKERILMWLKEETRSPDSAVGAFLRDFSLSPVQAVSPDAWELEEIRKRTESLEKETPSGGYFYGNEGKRAAVELFLGHLCLKERPFQLLLYSDEEMSWLYEDPVFARRWAALLKQLLSTGSRIRIPHNITRGSEEMFQAVQKWIPLYMTGAIEPLYFPGFRDGICRRSLFVAADDSALVSSSVRNETGGMLNLLISDRAAVRALEKEYWNYAGLCLPLMKVHRENDSMGHTLMSVFQGCLEREDRIIMAHRMPTAGVLPVRQAGDLYGKVAALYRNRLSRGGEIVEILNLPDPEQVAGGKVPLPFSDRQDSQTLTAELLELLIRGCIRMIRREPAYQVILSSAISQDIMLYAQQNQEALLMRACPPSVCFEVREKNLCHAFYGYLERIAEENLGREREETVFALRQYLERLQEAVGRQKKE